jgi:hypothetical protein
MNVIDSSTSKKKSKYFFPLMIGAIWNLIFGSLGLFNLQLINALFLNVITSEAKVIANHVWWFVVFVAGLGYGIVACIEYKFRFFVTIGAIGKIALFFFVIYLWVNSIATNFAAIVVTGDLIWAMYFFYFLFKTREYGYF